jgi:GT2 family glycosyltransferase
VLTYNARAYIERCLGAVFEQDYPSFEVVMVDNKSTDGTADFVRELFPKVRLIASDTNEGYGAGNNLGATVANGELLAFLNPDAVPQRTWLSHLVGRMREQFRQLATSRITLLSDEDQLNSSGTLIHYLGLAFCRGLKAPSSRFDHADLVPGASGAAFAISRELFEQLGGFDRSFFMYHDDVDLSLRALLAGERCLYVPQAVVAHEYTMRLPAMKWGWIEGHRYAVLLKTFSARTLLVLLPALVTMDVVTFAYLATRGPGFVAAKLRSYGWVARHFSAILRARRQAQSVRRLTDRQILSLLTDEIPYEQLTAGWLAQVCSWLIDPWFRVYRRFSLAIIRW